MLSLLCLALVQADEPVGVVSTPMPVKRPAPLVPMAPRWYTDGPVTCIVDLTISPEGKPIARVPVSAPEECPKRFMRSTKRRLKWWRFNPAMAGVPVEGQFRATLQFFESGEVVGADSRE